MSIPTNTHKYKLNNMKKINISEVSTLEQKYFNLVWYARVNPENYELEAVKDKMAYIENIYPTEVLDLSGAESQWHHGFNSGTLAGLRFILDISDGGSEYAKEEFPSLNT